ncbi:MAG: ATP-binding cassette domain-containing protein [Planctomycetaceae bacterium]|nr:ATP-binding cassette domain-containing protein [Planctomycetaceae bacterium]
MNSPLFSLRNVTLPARLNSVTVSIPRGSTAVVGLSGAGKTSLLNVLAGFESGFSGAYQNHAESADKSRLPLFWVPQSGGLWPHLSVEQHLDVVTPAAAQNHNSSSEFGRSSERTDELLGQFDLDQRRQAFPAELSQGERSRLALARALATRATVLLLDEPLSHVDPIRKPAYWKIVSQFVTAENISMIFASHEPESVLRQAEHVICLHHGTVEFEGPMRNLYDAPPSAFVGEFLGPLNWFTEDEAGVFLGGGNESAIRPEHLRLLVADSAVELIATPFAGTYCESVLRHVGTGRMKSVFHQVDVLPPLGARVVLSRVGANV